MLAVKIGDAQANDVRGMIVDPVTLEVWDESEDDGTMIAVSGRQMGVGKKDSELVAALDAARAEDVFEVIVWFKGPDIDSEAEQIARGLRIGFHGRRFVGGPASEKQADAELRRVYEDGCWNAGLSGMERVRRLGGRVHGPIASAPMVLAELRPSQIEALERDPDVCRLGLNGEVAPLLSSAVPTVYPKWFYNDGKYGQGVKVAVVENDRVDFSNAYLKYRNGGSYGQASRGSHATQVAGCIGMSRSGGSGVAPSVTILSADSRSWSYWDLINASDWALRNGAVVLNLSFGGVTSGIDSLTAYYDHVSGEPPYYATVVAAAGNYSNFSTYQILAPALGYNVLAVGAMADKNTSGVINDTTNTIWRDDSICSWSCYREPSWMGDRNKPEVCAPGASITTASLGTYGLSTVDGTSFAAPIVSGIVALEISKDPSLATWSRITRAITMATAQHRINTVGKSSLYFGSDNEGVGTVVASRACNLMRHGWYGKSVFYPGQTQIGHFTAQAGEIVRSANCWTSHTTSSGGVYGSDTLATDFDIYIYSPSGSLVGWSASYNNSYEVTEFKAPQAGTYTIKIVVYRMNVASEWMGWARYHSWPWYVW
jgi:subtilisin family serine protease